MTVILQMGYDTRRTKNDVVVDMTSHGSSCMGRRWKLLVGRAQIMSRSVWKHSVINLRRLICNQDFISEHSDL